MSKPVFDPSKPFEAADKPAFDPNKPFEEASNQKKSEKTSEDFSTSPLESAARGFADSATFGQSNNINAALGGLFRGGKYLANQTQGDKSLLDAIKNGYNVDAAAGKQADKNALNDQPTSYITGSVGAAVPQLMAGSAAVTLPSLLAQGAAQGAGHSSLNSPLDFAGDVSKDALTNGLAGKAGDALGAVAGKANNAITDIKNNLALRALGAQKTQLKGVNPEFKGDVAKYALDNNVLSANPLESLATQQNHVKNLQQSVGNSLNATRETMPTFDANELINAITNKNTFNPTLGVNKDLTKQLDTVRQDITNLSLPGTNNVPAKDVLDLKAQLYPLARKANGEVNPAKDVLENSRQAIGDVEKKVADSNYYNQDLRDYAILKKIEQLQGNKAAQKGNSALGMGGLVGGAGAMGALASGHPGIAAAGLLGLPAVRSAAGETSAVALDGIQKLASKLQIDPRVVAYLLSKKKSGENQ